MKKVASVLGIIVGALLVASSFLSATTTGRDMFIFQQAYLLIERIGGIVIILLGVLAWPHNIKTEMQDLEYYVKEILLSLLKKNEKEPKPVDYSKHGDFEGLPRRNNESDTDYWRRVAEYGKSDT